MVETKVSPNTIPVLLMLDGLLCVALAVFAFALGIDPNPDWGKSRVLLLTIGLALFCLSIFLLIQKPQYTNIENIKRVFLFGHVWLLIFTIYAWFITFGTFTEWRASTRYYSLLADAFNKGQLYVDVDPGQGLLNAEDPYNSEGRPAFNDDVWDLSLYKGKLFLYWGPVPALLLAPAQAISHTPLLDMYPVYFFICGLLIFNTLIILKVRDLFFPELSEKNVVLSIFLVGLILPILWSLNIPDVYEAAIGAGQFFLMGGIYFIIRAFEKDSKKSYLFLAGLFWACSVGSRAINVLSIIFLTIMALHWIWKHNQNPIKWDGISKLAGIYLLPLILGAILIGWYNYARFDSPLEFGLRYQITIYNLNRDMSLTFQPDYVPLNLYAHVIQPFEFVSKFPFIQPIHFSKLLTSLDISQPKLYSSGRVTGILFYAPALILVLIPFISKKRRDTLSLSDRVLFKFILQILGGTFLITFTTLMFYFYGQMRFQLDFISPAVLLSIIGYWMIIRSQHHLKTIIINTLLILTLTIGILLSFSSESSRMEKLSPGIMEKINSIFAK